MTDSASYERRGPLGLITLQRPDALNALTYEMIASVERFARDAERDPEVVAICITGAGRGFCAGIDMSVLAAHLRGENPEGAAPTSDIPAMFGFLLDISKPVIAAVNGVGAGGGFVLAMMCDLRFMAHDAYLTTTFSKRGLIAEHGTSWLLTRIVGLSRALDLLWSSRKLDAAEAYRIGFADRLMPSENLINSVEAYVLELSRNVSPRSLAVIKAQTLQHLDLSLRDAAINSDALMWEALARPDAEEGARSFVERRLPRFARWKGRVG